ncbi:MAG: response regulator [Methylococcaceae bacterium]
MTNQNNDVDILLVEDNPTDAELAILALKDRNLANKLVWVKDGDEALDFIFATGTYASRNIENYPRVILLDLRLPKVDGLEVLRIVKTDERTKRIPVTVLTSSKEDRDVVASYNLGVNSFISKPVEFNEFAKVVSDLGYYWLFINRPPIKGEYP